ncbi:hypothetical protein LZC95_11680 [Pendulispora brunnea]|uniref:Uncharacterized protein n=1 Tax=Pendulispora brunnea TaxID=2905690 RepID=A0ABZ2KQM3_9BACT
MVKSFFLGGALLALGLVSACGAPSESERTGSRSDALTSVAATLTPSNLPADTCDTPGTRDFTGGRLPEACDAVVHQNGAPDICVYKFAHVAGDIERGNYEYELIAVVATHSMQLGSYTVPFAFGQREGLGWGQRGEMFCGGSGGGYGTAGGGPGGGAAFGAETAIPLHTGGYGGYACGDGCQYIVDGGKGASAVQFVSCGTMEISGSIVADGEQGGFGMAAGAGGGGGGAGGTILIEAAQVTARTGSVLRANGGEGGWSRTGGTGASGGSAGSPPGAATCGPGGGAGGAVGRIRINVPAGTQPELLGNVSPAPSIGVVSTH